MSAERGKGAEDVYARERKIFQRMLRPKAADTFCEVAVVG